MYKILFVSNTANFSKFNKPLINWCKNNGWQVDYCAPNDEEIKDCNMHFKVSIPRNPFSLKVFTVIKELKKILEKENYDIIHCHTPMGSVVARLAAKKLYDEKKIKIIYTAHGFHFYKGASLLNWLIYYPVEKILSRYCDYLITINKEDYELAKSKFKKTKVLKLDGVGVNFEKFYPVNNKNEKKLLRLNYGYNEDDFIILYIAEFIPRKNHQQFFSIMTELQSKITNLKVILAGKGELFNYFQNSIMNNKEICGKYNFLGYSSEIDSYCRISDILLTTSFQEGLPISMIEAIGTGLPVIASNIRGHVDVIENGYNGFLCDLNNNSEFCNAVYKLYTDKDLYTNMSKNAIESSKKFSTEIAVEKTTEIYGKLINEKE